VFGLGTLVGFVVGVVIGYQIMYASVTSNLAQYATLKAIGYGDGFLLGVVVREGLLLSAFGFVPGAVLSAGLYRLMAVYGHLPMRMSVGGAALIFALTAALCALSAAVAARKVLSSDPAEVF
jgi:putative ABC transport system permease protein